MRKFFSVFTSLIVLSVVFSRAETIAQDSNSNGLKRPPAAKQQERQRREMMRGQAQRGNTGLKIGETAPAFELKSLDGKSTTELAKFKNQKPVVLFFGSYS